MTSSTRSKRTAMMALLSLAIGSFGIGMTEFVVMGLLTQTATDLLPALSATDPDTAIAHTGWLISLYALGVVVGAPTISASVAKYPRHRVMLALAAVLTLFNALTFVMPTFELVAVSRFLAGLPHGAYFGIGALAVAAVPIALFVPAHAGDPGRTLRAELGVFRIPQVWLTLAVGAIGFGGFFAAYSYIASIVTEVAGAALAAAGLVLALVSFGVERRTSVPGAPGAPGALTAADVTAA
ncbi:MFS transporter [Microbacterium lacticum]